MLGCTDEECRDRREYAKLHLKGTALDPMIRDYRDRPMDGMTYMVESDKADIDACDIVLVNARQTERRNRYKSFIRLGARQKSNFGSSAGNDS